jgi:hypothetical protein
MKLTTKAGLQQEWNQDWKPWNMLLILTSGYQICTTCPNSNIGQVFFQHKDYMKARMITLNLWQWVAYHNDNRTETNFSYFLASKQNFNSPSPHFSFFFLNSSINSATRIQKGIVNIQHKLQCCNTKNTCFVWFVQAR